MVYTPTKLRAELYRVLDQVLVTGNPVEVIHKGRRLRIAPVVPSRKKLARLEPHRDFIVGNPDDLLKVDWLRHWKPVL